MRRETAIAVGVVAVILAAGMGYLAGSANERIVTSVSTTTTIVGDSSPPFGYITIFEGCTLSVSSHTPCIGSPAYVFNSCINNQSMPATPHTCGYTLNGPFIDAYGRPYPTYSFNVTLGVRGQSGVPGWADCSVSGGIGYADCIPVINSTAFIVAVPTPPPQ